MKRTEHIHMTVFSPELGKTEYWHADNYAVALSILDLYDNPNNVSMRSVIRCPIPEKWKTYTIKEAYNKRPVVPSDFSATGVLVGDLVKTFLNNYRDDYKTLIHLDDKIYAYIESLELNMGIDGPVVLLNARSLSK